MPTFVEWLCERPGQEAQVVRDAILAAVLHGHGGPAAEVVAESGNGLEPERQREASRLLHEWRQLATSNGAPPLLLPAHARERLPRQPTSATANIQLKEKDAAGNVVRRIFVRTDKFVIYSADDEDNSDDACSLHYTLAVDYDRAKPYRAHLLEVAPAVACITDTICAMKPLRWSTMNRRYFSTRERAFELMARAMAFAFEGHADAAKAILASLRQEIEERRDSNNRMRYIAATTVSFLMIVVGWLVWRQADIDLFSVPVKFGDVPIPVANVLLLGALGAFFSVVIDVRKVKVNHTIAIAEMLYAGSIRVPVGLIAAAVVMLLVAGGWILGSVGDDYRVWSVYLFAFLAGFSEMFVPNALKQMEEKTVVERPDQVAGAASASRHQGAAP